MTTTGRGLSGTSNATASAPLTVLIFFAFRSARTAAAMSLSRPIFDSARAGFWSLTISVTSAPRLAKICANSMATMPEPVMAIDFGR